MNEITSRREEMDEMRVKSGFLKGIISVLIQRLVKKKLGTDVGLYIDDLDVRIRDKAELHLEISLTMEKDQLKALIFKGV